jgi:hypothetical protein
VSREFDASRHKAARPGGVGASREQNKRLSSRS